jgi:hypothetical protein
MEIGAQNPQILYRTDHDWEGDQSLSMTVIDAVSDVSGTDPTDLPPLYDSINPEALDNLFTSERVGSVSFEFAGMPVSVHATGEVLVHSR